MYSLPFYITNPVWNNAFSFEKRNNKKLYIPSLIKANCFENIQLWEEVVFEDFDFDNKLQTCTGLKNLYEFDYNWKSLYLFDNHNYAYYFWHKAKKEWIIKDNSILYHMDEHADTRDPWIYLEKEKLDDLQNVFDYTNFTLNVGNYIIPALEDWLIKEVVQIRSETELLKVKWLVNDNKKEEQSIILNLDLDFFQPELDFIDYNLKKEVIQKLASKASVITVATSPFFINQKLALDVFKDIFFLNSWFIIKSDV